MVIDPGHGGSDSGAVNKTYGLTEEAQNLDVAKRLETLLEAEGYTVCMTRTGDETLSNNDRYTYANTTGAELLISVHMNGSSNLQTDYTTTLFGKWRKDKALAETVFITSDKEGRLLPDGSGARQQQIAEALKTGVDTYLSRN